MKALSIISTLLVFHIQLLTAQAAPDQKQETGVGYRLAPNDLIHVSVYQENDLESRLRISRDGSITFPLLGNVKVAGKTLDQAAAALKTLLEKDYLVNPQVTVTLLEQAARRFTVLGQVQRPGTFRIPDGEGIDLLQAIGMAGGYTRIANPAKVTIKRKNQGKEEVIQVNAKEMARDQNATALEIFPSDIITVNESLF
jgi:protein involved in polysaccharide export with SLBB domain